jgi:predicted PurR-regulated permease PerM
VFGAACVVVVLAGVRSVADLLNPVLLAGFLALVLQPVLDRLRPLGGAAAAVVVIVVIAFGLALVVFVGVSLHQLALELPRYQGELQALEASVTRALAARGIDVAAYVQSSRSGPTVPRVLISVLQTAAGWVGSQVATLFIFAFMLAGMWELERRASPEALDHSRLAARFLAFSSTLRSYTRARCLLGLAAALLNFLVLLLVGVDHALLWAVLSFLLSFVPNVGFIVSLLPPALLTLLSQGWMRAAVVVVGYMVINVVLDRVVEPRVMGRQMHISPLLSFLCVIFWAWLLGPTGAILAVPLTVFIKDYGFGSTEQSERAPLIASAEYAEAAPPSAAIASSTLP